jgi:hypothetical protein
MRCSVRRCCPRRAFGGERLAGSIASRNTTEEGLDYIRGSLRDKAPAIRMAAVEAVGRMTSENRAKFKDDLQRLLAQSDETEEIRIRALHVLQQSGL